MSKDKKSQATKLVELVDELAGQGKVELFHDPDSVGYATIDAGGHQETHPLRVRSFRTWLRRLFFDVYAASPGSQAVQDAIDLLDARALFDGPAHPVHVRIAGDDNCIWLDLADSSWRVVEVGASGWRVLEGHEAPVKFRRRRGMEPLPVPERGGKIDGLWDFANVEDPDRPLVAGFLAKSFRPKGPYPVLNLLGEQGSAKTTTGRVLRRLVDPNKADLRDCPREGRDLMIAATNGWVVGFDNVSRLQPWLSDALCRLATGAGFSTRELYSDDEEVIFSACQPVILTSIVDVATRPDLLDRSLLVFLPQVRARRDEKEFWREFDAAHPQMLGGVLDAVACAIRRIDDVPREDLPRMADFAMWAVAAEPALGLDPGRFLTSYHANLRIGTDVALESSVVGPVLVELVKRQRVVEGRAKVILDLLTDQLDAAARPPDGWPKTAQGFVAELKRLAPTLRESDVDVAYDGRKAHGQWRLRWVGSSDLEEDHHKSSVERTLDKNKPGREPSKPTEPTNAVVEGSNGQSSASVPTKANRREPTANRREPTELTVSDAVSVPLTSGDASPSVPSVPTPTQSNDVCDRCHEEGHASSDCLLPF